jgi:hypothetical protein
VGLDAKDCVEIIRRPDMVKERLFRVTGRAHKNPGQREETTKKINAWGAINETCDRVRRLKRECALQRGRRGRKHAGGTLSLDVQPRHRPTAPDGGNAGKQNMSGPLENQQCFGCKETIAAGTKFFKVGNYAFHEAHFTCAVCSCSLSGVRYTRFQS